MGVGVGVGVGVGSSGWGAAGGERRVGSGGERWGAVGSGGERWGGARWGAVESGGERLGDSHANTSNVACLDGAHFLEERTGLHRRSSSEVPSPHTTAVAATCRSPSPSPAASSVVLVV